MRRICRISPLFESAITLLALIEMHRAGEIVHLPCTAARGIDDFTWVVPPTRGAEAERNFLSRYGYA
jgi:hypothetical protein